MVEAARRAAEASAPLNVDPQELVRELEEFLHRRSRSQQADDGTDGQDGEGGHSGDGGDGGDGGGGDARPEHDDGTTPT